MGQECGCCKLKQARREVVAVAPGHAAGGFARDLMKALSVPSPFGWASHDMSWEVSHPKPALSLCALVFTNRPHPLCISESICYYCAAETQVSLLYSQMYRGEQTSPDHWSHRSATSSPAAGLLQLEKAGQVSVYMVLGQFPWELPLSAPCLAGHSQKTHSRTIFVASSPRFYKREIT